MNFSAALLWFLLGASLSLAEIFLPGFILLFFAAGSWLVALLLLFIDITVTQQIAIALISSLLLLALLRKYCLQVFTGGSKNSPDEFLDGQKSAVGDVAQVTKSITPFADGEVKYMGSYWRATADENIEEGQNVLIVKISDNGLYFRVKKR